MSLGRQVFEYNKDNIRTRIIRHDLPFKKNYLYIPRGPEIDFNEMLAGFKNPVANFIKYLKELAKAQKSVFVKTEPSLDNIAQMLAERGFKRSKKRVQPSKTVIVNLSQSEAELKNGMHHKTRYNIGLAERRGIHVGESGDAGMFWRLLGKTSKRDKFFPHPKDYYEKLLSFFKNSGEIEVKLFMAEHKNKPISAAIVLLYKGTGHYLHGASDYKYRQHMAPYLLHWSIIKYLKGRGLLNYDLWGIDAEKWPGVTRFKLGFGGKVTEYPGSFDLVVSKFWYLLYNIAGKIRGV